MSVCCYFAFFFMSGYKYRQSRAALKRLVSMFSLQAQCRRSRLEEFRGSYYKQFNKIGEYGAFDSGKKWIGQEDNIPQRLCGVFCRMN